jgi:hypothetical protein
MSATRKGTIDIRPVTPQFPAGAPVYVSALRDVTTGSSDLRLPRRHRALIWTMQAPYAHRETAGDFGFIWDKRMRRWWTDNSGNAVKVAEYCDLAALDALDEDYPDWRRYRPDLFPERTTNKGILK